jgi:uncharacterized membrane protein YidH (DUF202 family)
MADAAKVEPKVFFANERTFLSWMHMSVRCLASPCSAALASFVVLVCVGDKRLASRALQPPAAL